MRLVAIFALLHVVGCETPAASGSSALPSPITVTVTDAGFVPKDFSVRVNTPVELSITRKEEATCATEIVIDEYKINQPLPLNQTVSVKFTPTAVGPLKYGCAMKKMIGGTITVVK